MSAHRLQLRALLAAIVLRSATSFTWCGEATAVVGPRRARALPATTVREWLRGTLQARLYQDFYCAGGPVRGRGRASAMPLDGRSGFVEALSAANSGRGSWQTGWRVASRGAGTLDLDRASLRLTVSESSPDVDPATVGGGTRIRLPKESLKLSPGFYVARGDEELSDAHAWERIYWHLSARGAVAFVRQATRMLNEARVPFLIKVSVDAAADTRCDAVVLYVPGAGVAATWTRDVGRALDVLYVRAARHLRRGTPALTRTLAPGVGWAQDPGGGQSFGWHRCGLIADALVTAREQGARSIDDRLRIIEARFASEGLTLDAPFLGPDAHASAPDERDSRPFGRAPALAAAARIGRLVSPRMARRVAERIGRRLCRDALWHDGRCTWIGEAPPDVRDDPAQSGARANETLGPDLYGGTSGVALFLADLFLVTGSEATRATATGAMRQALASLHQVPAACRHGLYGGALGVVASAARVGSRIGDTALLDRASRAAEAIVRDQDASGHFDLMSGLAGGIIALLGLSHTLGSPAWIAEAARLGDALIEARTDDDNDDNAWGWRSPTFPDGRPLTGLSHGASGAALALLELWAVTGEARYRSAATRALAYEHGCYDARLRNWPDFRVLPGRARQSRPRGMTTWCHGAAGIALSRARMLELVSHDSPGHHHGPDRGHDCGHEHAAIANDAIIAIETTTRMLREALRSDAHDLSLCHGLIGLIEIIEESSTRLRVAGLECPHDLDTLIDAGAAAAFLACHDDMYPSAHGGLASTPGLMLGLSGLGHFFLRRSRTSLSSVLLPSSLVR